MSAASTVVLDATALASTAAEDRISLEWVKAALRLIARSASAR